jgi:uncharacterized protein (DUF1330 family)
MAAYLIARIEVTNPERYQQYVQRTPGIVRQYGGRFIVRGGEILTLEGPNETRRMVVLEFPSLAQAKTFYESPEYQQVKNLRLESSTAEFIVVQGC